MAQSVQYLYEFESFRLDPSKRLLLRAGEVVQLTPKCFEILLALVEHSGEVVSKENLINRVWPDSFVEEGNLTYNISMLRKALGERAGENQYILTVPGKGYRFTADVKLVVDKPEEGEVERTTTSHEGFLRKRVAVIAALVIGLGAVLFYWSISHSAPTTESNSPAAVKSIAVLPLKLEATEKSDSEMEYLSDGISESIINRLAQLGGLKVIARSSSFKYKGKDPDPEEVAKALGVESVLTGRVLQRGELLQISVELMDARQRTQLWGEQYTPKATDLLALQSEISGEIARNLRLKLTNAEQQQLARRETVNPEAYEMILRGRSQREKGGSENLKSAVEFFKRAIAIDPAYATAYAELSIIYGVLSGYSLLDPKEYRPQAEVAARKALELDDNLAEAHYALANVEMDAWNWAAAGDAFERALALNPGLARARWRHALYLSIMGQHDRAIAEIERARELNPLSPRFKAWVALILINARRNDEALKVLQNTLAIDQNSGEAQKLLGHAYVAKGMYAEAIAAYKKAIKVGLDSSSTKISLGMAYAKTGQHEKALTILKHLQTSKEYVSPCELAVLYIALDQREAAFASLERAYVEHDLQLGGLGQEPGFEPIRSDPRFTDLMRRVGLPQ